MSACALGSRRRTMQPREDAFAGCDLAIVAAAFLSCFEQSPLSYRRIWSQPGCLVILTRDQSYPRDFTLCSSRSIVSPEGCASLVSAHR